MANFGATIFNNAVSSLNAQQAVIANVGNNIANVNTEGYARRIVELQTRLSAGSSAGINVGSGVEVASISRVNNEFIDSLVRETASTMNSLQIQDEFLSRVEPLFSLSGDNVTIGKALSEFFGAIDNLTVNPASIELRSDMIERGQDLINAIDQTFSGLSNLQAEAEDRLGVEITTVNSLTSQIATLNGLVSSKELTGEVAADERDRRDLLLQQLSEKIGYTMIESADGQVTVSLENGFPLVTGVNSRELEVTNNPSFAATDNPYMLDGSLMSFVVYDYDSGAGTAHLNLTEQIKDAGGAVGGLLEVRGTADAGDVGSFSADGPLVELAARVESVTHQLLTTFNAEYIAASEGDQDGVTAGFQSLARDLDNNQPGVFGFFDYDFAGTKDADGDGIAGQADLNDVLFGGATGTVGNFSTLLQLTSTDPRDVAAGRLSAAQFTNGDAISPGDADNLTALSALQSSDQTFSGTLGTGANAAFANRTTTFGNFYNESVGRVGNLRSRSVIDASVAEDNYFTAVNRREEVSGVSLDEEFTALIRFQKAFEASARMIRVGDELLEQIVNLI